MASRAELIEEARLFINSNTGVTRAEILDYLIETFPELVAENYEAAVRTHTWGVIRQSITSPQENPQPTFPGFNVPATITVPGDEGQDVTYVSAEKATRTQWCAHRIMKMDNIIRAQKELEEYDDLTDKLNTVWAAEPSLTVGECLRKLSA